MENDSDKVNFSWWVADVIRDSFKRGKYQQVILPRTALTHRTRSEDWGTGNNAVPAMPISQRAYEE